MWSVSATRHESLGTGSQKCLTLLCACDTLSRSASTCRGISYFTTASMNMRYILPVAVATGLVLGGATQAEEHHRQWFRFLKGDWSFAWESEVDAFKGVGEGNTSIVAGGDGVLASVTYADGTQDTELGGWQAKKEAVVVTGYSTGGGHWFVEYTDIDKDKMSGGGHGVFDNGMPWEGKVILLKKGRNYEIHIGSTSEGEKPVAFGRATRKRKLSRGQEEMQQLEFLVGKWNRVDENGKTRRETSKWINNKSYMLFTLGQFEYTEVVGWDLQAQQIVSWAFGAGGMQGKLYWRKEGDSWHVEAKPAFYDRTGKPMVWKWTLRQIDDDTVKVEGQTGPGRFSATSHRIKE